LPSERRLEALLLVPVVICFYVVPQHAAFPPFIAFTLFGCLALSRLGLYAFDLVQVQCLQLELQHHPKRNRFTSLQIAMQSVSDLAKWGMVFVFSRPDQ
jgi:iron-regulated transporter 1